MENRTLSTTYAPLQPPYQIIKYGHQLAMQIGTLIVTIQKDTPGDGRGYEIETHSHPVVAYENKMTQKEGMQLSNHMFMEGAVWNNVELKDVTTVCLSDKPLLWEEFVRFLYEDHKRLRLDDPLEYRLFWQLRRLGVAPLPLKLVDDKDYMKVELIFITDHLKRKWVTNPYLVPLRERWDEDLNAMSQRIRSSLAELFAMGLPREIRFFSLDDDLKPLAEELNKPHNSVHSARFTVRAVEGYEGSPIK